VATALSSENVEHPERARTARAATTALLAVFWRITLTI
jgi:hypothetical protein